MTDIYELADEIVDRYAELQPLEATYIGVPGHDHRWGDLSPAGNAAVEAMWREYRRRIEGLPDTDDRWAALARRVAAEYLDIQLDWFAHGEDLLDLNSIDSTLQRFRDVFDIMDKETKAGWENICGRLETIGDAADGYVETLEAGRRDGRTVAARQVRVGAEQTRSAAGVQSPFVRLLDQLADSGVGDDALADRLAAAVAGAREAMGGLADYLEGTYAPAAVSADGVGRERYVRLARSFLGTALDPDETYAWGWAEVARLRAMMEAVAAEIQPGAGLAEVIELLQTDPARAAAGHDEFIELMRARQLGALADLDGIHFRVPDEIRAIDVKIASPGGALGASYVVPSEDFSRPGTVWYALDERPRVPLYDQISTAYHEGFPGHHLQCGTQVALADRLSRLHRLLIWYSGYGEGWALYAEQLMSDLGYLEKPDYVMGLLAAQILRACRVVIDIGNHLDLPIPKGQPFHPGERWSFETAVEMLVDYATLPLDYASSEVNRYLGWPGQAISYKVGERAILALRADMAQRDGDGFDLAEFHRLVIDSGPLGLDMLREVVLGAG